MHREYHKWYSPHLGRDMELLVFGHAGKPIIFFPTRCARFYDYENWEVFNDLRGDVEHGEFQIYCVDSIDNESFYCYWCKPEEKINRHLLYEKYIIEEVVPFIKIKNNDPSLISAGFSMGAYHAINTVFRNPGLFTKVIGMSGRYDLTYEIGNFRDLFDGYWDQEIYFNMPTQYMANMIDSLLIEQLQQLEIILVMGKEDLFLQNNLILSQHLCHKNIEHSLHLWEREAHKPWYWRRMLEMYL
jgi:esterase/lipase superfamily enzyme